VPFGYALHRKLQDVGGSSHLDIEDHYARKRKFLKRVEEQGLLLAGRDFLEIGTGWHPVLPVLLHLLDVRHVTTIDVNPWLTHDSLAETFRAFQGIAGRVAADFGRDPARTQATMDRLCQQVEDASMPIPEVLKAANIRYGMPVDACKTPYDAGSFDYVVSCVTTVNFLRYSPQAWHWIGGSGLAYHNRLRCVEYARMLETAGFTVTYVDTEVDPRGLEALEQRRVLPHPDFAGFTHEELSGNVIDVFARAPENGSVRENA
jgi:hypothetical protein